MNLFKTTLFLCLAILLFGCQNSEKQNATASTGDTSQLSNKIPANANTLVRAKYIAATVYAASTDYVFETESGEQLMIRAGNLPEMEGPEVPDNMLESLEGDGPPDANPKLVGTYFILEKDAAGNYLSIKEEK